MDMTSVEWLARWLIPCAIPLFLLAIALELLVLRRRRDARHRGYALRDSAASLSMGVINLGTQLLAAGYSFALMVWLYEYRIFDLPATVWWTWPLLWLAEDFCYYWFHRVSHRVRLYWAAHVNHHSSQHYNLTTALRQSATSPLYGFVFWLPLPLIGFHPLAVLVAHAASLLYQFWIHTEAIGRLGPLEAVLNTPSHHRVHHAANPEYIDRNYGGWLIVWDRMFGSFQAERADLPVRYGLVHDIDTYNPLRIAFHEWARMLRETLRARRARHALVWLFGPPEVQPGTQAPTQAPEFSTNSS